MNSRERMLCALDRGVPDRLPVTVHQWQQFHLDHYMGGASRVEAFQQTGLDAQVQYFGEVGQAQEQGEAPALEASDWRIELEERQETDDVVLSSYTVHTPDGNLSYSTGSNERTTWTTEYLIKKDEDIELIRKYMPVPELNNQAVRELYDKVGDAGILRGFVWGGQAGCWQHACCLMEMDKLILACFDKPDWVHELLDILLQKKLQFVETMEVAKFDLVETGGGASSSTLISPDIHRRFCLPYDRKLHRALHRHDFRISYHTCGGTKNIEEYIVKNECDVSETLAPSTIGGNQEPWEFAEKIDGRLGLIGGIDQFSVLTHGSPGDVRETVHELFEKVGQDGGYICSACDHFFDVPPENLRAMGEAARECTY